MKRRFWKYLSREIEIEYKACLYFCCIAFFYFCFLLCKGQYSARILFMFEMILTAYLVGYLQVYALENFDESDRMGRREAVASVLCTAIYTAAAAVFGWFDGSPLVMTLFFVYMLLVYVCIWLVNRTKRKIDTEYLNDMLERYKRGDQNE